MNINEEKAENTPAGGVLVGKKEGQTIIHDKGTMSGYLVGKLHKDGGIKAVNKATGQPLEMQGGEVVITAPAVSDQTKREFEGKMMTNREILSAINEKGGGVSFANGGDIPAKIHTTDCEYKLGGKVVKDTDIANSLGMNSTLKKGKQQFSSGDTTYDVDAIYNAIKKGKLRLKTKEVETFPMKYPVYDKNYAENHKIDFRKPNGITVLTESGEEVLIDGNHRMNNAYSKGRKTMKTYYVEDSNQISKFSKKNKFKLGGETMVEEIDEDYSKNFDSDRYSSVFYREKTGNFLLPKNKIYFWVYDIPNAIEKLNNQEFDFLFFPFAIKYAQFHKDFVPPLKQVWTKKYQKANKGAEHLIGIIECFFSEAENKLYVQMMTVRPDFQRQGLNSFMINTVRTDLGLSKEDVIFVDATEEGKQFEESGKFKQGGHLSSGKSLKQIAEMHNVSLTHINEELAKGLEVEKEHFADFKERTRVAKDHLVENPNYYTILQKAGLKMGGHIQRQELVEKSKKGDTPARDLNNYNDVMDLEADGMVGMESGLAFAKGGLVTKGNLKNIEKEFLSFTDNSHYKGIYDEDQIDYGVALEWGKYGYSVSEDQQEEDYKMLKDASAKFNSKNIGKLYASTEFGDKFNTVTILDYDMLANDGELVFRLPEKYFAKLKVGRGNNRYISQRIKEEADKIKELEAVGVISKKLGVSQEKAENILFSLKYDKEYYEKNKNQSKPRFDVFSSRNFPSKKFENLEETLDYIQSDAFANSVYMSTGYGNPISEGTVHLYGWGALSIKYKQDDFPFRPDGSTDFTKDRTTTLKIHPYLAVNVSGKQDFMTSFKKGISDFVWCYNYYVLGTNDKKNLDDIENLSDLLKFVETGSYDNGGITPIDANIEGDSVDIIESDFANGGGLDPNAIAKLQGLGVNVNQLLQPETIMPVILNNSVQELVKTPTGQEIPVILLPVKKDFYGSFSQQIYIRDWRGSDWLVNTFANIKEQICLTKVIAGKIANGIFEVSTNIPAITLIEEKVTKRYQRKIVFYQGLEALSKMKDIISKDLPIPNLAQPQATASTSAKTPLTKEELYNSRIWIGDNVELRDKVIAKLQEIGIPFDNINGNPNADKNIDINIFGYDFVVYKESKEEFDEDTMRKEIFPSDLGIDVTNMGVASSTSNALTSTKPFDFSMTKIDVSNNPELSVKVQKKAFEDGWEWENVGGKTIDYNNFNYLYFTKTSISYGNNPKSFNNSPKRKITESEIFGIKSPTKNKPIVESVMIGWKETGLSLEEKILKTPEELFNLLKEAYGLKLEFINIQPLGSNFVVGSSIITDRLKEIVLNNSFEDAEAEFMSELEFGNFPELDFSEFIRKSTQTTTASAKPKVERLYVENGASFSDIEKVRLYLDTTTVGQDEIYFYINPNGGGDYIRVEMKDPLSSMYYNRNAGLEPKYEKLKEIFELNRAFENYDWTEFFSNFVSSTNANVSTSASSQAPATNKEVFQVAVGYKNDSTGNTGSKRKYSIKQLYDFLKILYVDYNKFSSVSILPIGKDYYFYNTDAKGIDIYDNFWKNILEFLSEDDAKDAISTFLITSYPNLSFDDYSGLKKMSSTPINQGSNLAPYEASQVTLLWANQNGMNEIQTFITGYGGGGSGQTFISSLKDIEKNSNGKDVELTIRAYAKDNDGNEFEKNDYFTIGEKYFKPSTRTNEQIKSVTEEWIDGINFDKFFEDVIPLSGSQITNLPALSKDDLKETRIWIGDDVELRDKVIDKLIEIGIPIDSSVGNKDYSQDVYIVIYPKDFVVWSGIKKEYDLIDGYKEIFPSDLGIGLPASTTMKEPVVNKIKLYVNQKNNTSVAYQKTAENFEEFFKILKDLVTNIDEFDDKVKLSIFTDNEIEYGELSLATEETTFDLLTDDEEKINIMDNLTVYNKGLNFTEFFSNSKKTQTPTVSGALGSVQEIDDLKKAVGVLEGIASQASKKYNTKKYEENLQLLKEVKEEYELALSFTPESSFMYERIELMKKITEVQKEITRITELKNGGAFYILSKVIDRLEKGEDWKELGKGEIMINEVPQQEIDTVIYTENFKNWFGDWEKALVTKDYDYVSKVLTESGKPCVMYHGAKRIKYSYRQVSNGVLYLAENRSYAEWFSSTDSPYQKQGDYLTQCFVNVKNPIDLTPFGVEEVDLRDIIQYIDTLYPLAKIYDVLPPNVAMAIMNNQLIGRNFRAWYVIRQFPELNKHIRDNTTYDGFIYYENNPSDMIINESGEMVENVTKATAVFNSSQVKLVDAMLFDGSLDDWRFEKGGKVN